MSKTYKLKDLHLFDKCIRVYNINLIDINNIYLLPGYQWSQYLVVIITNE